MAETDRIAFSRSYLHDKTFFFVFQEGWFVEVFFRQPQIIMFILLSPSQVLKLDNLEVYGCT